MPGYIYSGVYNNINSTIRALRCYCRRGVVSLLACSFPLFSAFFQRIEIQQYPSSNMHQQLLHRYFLSLVPNVLLLLITLFVFFNTAVRSNSRQLRTVVFTYRNDRIITWYHIIIPKFERRIYNVFSPLFRVSAINQRMTFIAVCSTVVACRPHTELQNMSTTVNLTRASFLLLPLSIC